MKTTTIRGIKVAAKDTKYGVSPYHFANRTQAERKAAEMNGRVFKFPGGRPFYVEVA
jgi:hypothetical protein